MKVKELIEKLQSMNLEHDVEQLWDGATYTTVDHVYASKSGKCVLAGYGEMVEFDEDRPIDAPDDKQAPSWYLPENKKITENLDCITEFSYSLSKTTRMVICTGLYEGRYFNLPFELTPEIIEESEEVKSNFLKNKCILLFKEKPR